MVASDGGRVENVEGKQMHSQRSKRKQAEPVGHIGNLQYVCVDNEVQIGAMQYVSVVSSFINQLSTVGIRSDGRRIILLLLQ